MSNEKQTRPFFTASRLAAIAVFSALSGVLYVLGFSIPVAFAPWLELNFSDVPLLIGTFALGTPSGACIALLRTLVKIIFKPTSTAFVGEAADIIIGLMLAVPAGLIYQKKKTLKGAIFACVIGGVCSSATAMLANRVMLIPFYVKAMGWDFTFLASMLQPLYKNCTAETFYNYYLWLSVLPFNLLRCAAASLLTFAAYKKISVLLKRADEKFGKKRAGKALRAADTPQNDEEEKEKNGNAVLPQEKKEEKIDENG